MALEESKARVENQCQENSSGSICAPGPTSLHTDVHNSRESGLKGLSQSSMSLQPGQDILCLFNLITP